MIGVVIDREVVATIPTPVSGEIPVPISDLEIETAGKPEAVAVAVKALDTIAIRRAGMFKVAVLEGTRYDITLVVRPVVAVPVIVADVRHGINALVVAFFFGPRISFTLRRWSLWNAALVGAWPVLMVVVTFFFAVFRALREGGHDEQESQGDGQCDTELHHFLSLLPRVSGARNASREGEQPLEIVN